MPTRNDRQIVVRYALIDLTHPDISEAIQDFKSVLRRVGNRLELGINRKLDGTRAVIKVIHFPDDTQKVNDWFLSRSWRGAVLQITNWNNREQVRDFVSRVEWAGDPELPIQTPSRRN